MSNKATTPATTPNQVRIWVSTDEDANRVSAVLEALGYIVVRELEEGDGPARLRWADQRLAKRHKLTDREQDILGCVLAGGNNDEIAKQLEISRATVKWHMHNVFAKTNTSNRESLLRLALQLGGARPPKSAEADAPKPVEAEIVTEAHDAAKDPIPAAAVPSKSWF